MKVVCVLAGAALPLASLGLASSSALAQYLPPSGAVQTVPAQKSPPTRPPAAKSPPESAPADRSDGQLRQRVEQLEEQLVDLHVVIGTLESLARNAGGAAPPMRGVPMAGGSLGGSDGARLDALETQIRALTAQLEQLAEQVKSGDARGAAGFAPAPGPSRAPGLQRGGGGALAAPAAPPPGPLPAFGSTVIAPAGDQVASNSSEETALAPGSLEALPYGSDGGNPKQAYETAYGYLLQQNYSAAETAFDDFLKRYPNDALAGNAQYWLGESLFVRGQYKASAAAFLKGYQSYGRSAKAPDSLLKLAMSLDRLGQKDAACSSYAELTARFPTAPAQLKTRAQSERQRAGC